MPPFLLIAVASFILSVTGTLLARTQEPYFNQPESKIVDKASQNTTAPNVQHAQPSAAIPVEQHEEFFSLRVRVNPGESLSVKIDGDVTILDVREISSAETHDRLASRKTVGSEGNLEQEYTFGIRLAQGETVSVKTNGEITKFDLIESTDHGVKLAKKGIFARGGENQASQLLPVRSTDQRAQQKHETVKGEASSLNLEQGKIGAHVPDRDSPDRGSIFDREFSNGYALHHGECLSVKADKAVRVQCLQSREALHVPQEKTKPPEHAGSRQIADIAPLNGITVYQGETVSFLADGSVVRKPALPEKTEIVRSTAIQEPVAADRRPEPSVRPDIHSGSEKTEGIATKNLASRQDRLSYDMSRYPKTLTTGKTDVSKGLPVSKSSEENTLQGVRISQGETVSFQADGSIIRKKHASSAELPESIHARQRADKPEADIFSMELENGISIQQGETVHVSQDNGMTTAAGSSGADIHLTKDTSPATEPPQTLKGQTFSNAVYPLLPVSD